MVARSRTGVPVLGIVLAMAALAGCETADRDRDRDGDGGRYGDSSGGGGDVLGGILGGVLGGRGRGGGGSSGGLLGQRVSYRCDDDRRFTASFQPFGGGVSVDAGGRTYRLRPRDGGSDRYRRDYRSEDGEVRLEVDGDRADLRVEGGDDYRDCEAR